MARLFYALSLPAKTRNAICAWRERLPLGNPRWSQGGNLHLTLSFLGEQAEEKLPQLLSCAAGLEARDFRLELKELHYWRHADVLVLSPRDTPEALTRLVEALQTNLAAAGIGHDRKSFRPHVTLARHCRLDEDLDLQALAPKRAFGFQAREFGLYESRDGRYTPLAQWRLST
ncbi:MAG: RNA 2',3'-cyclic phosphodiesterase [Gammaproteobacteria bacterium]|nr:RNA 2',3'-cyclic phosphodiesterase [Gammaproteobacteria bacterium]